MYKLRLKNYRGFIDSQFEFSRINVFIGENSAGKSSIFKFLLALKQSFNAANAKEYNLALGGPDVDLGSYREVIFDHDVDRDLSFEFEFGTEFKDFVVSIFFPEDRELPDSKTTIHSVFEKAGKHPTSIEFKLTNDLGDPAAVVCTISNRHLGVLRISYDNRTDSQSQQDAYVQGGHSSCNLEFISKSKRRSIFLENVFCEKMGFLSLIVPSSLAERLRDIEGEKFPSPSYYEIAFLLIAQNYLQSQLARLQYCNPLVSPPAQRIYLEGDRKNIQRIRNVAELVDFINTNRTRTSFADELSSILKAYGIADSIRVKKVGFTNELRVIVDGIDSNIKDVGFGVSVQLPIFAQAILSERRESGESNLQISRGDVLLIEQPEVHLHPRLQAKFIEVLLSLGNNNIYFIETHSEHILRMMQVLTKRSRRRLPTDDVSIYYFKKRGKRMSAKPHLISTERGSLEPPLPKGFYDISYELAFELLQRS